MSARRLGPACAALAALTLAAPARAAQLFLSTERPFAPDAPGAVVKLEVPGARSVDVRLYRLDDPERFFASQQDLRHVENPTGRPEKKGERPKRAPGPLSLIGGGLSRAALDAREALQRGLSPAARALLAAAVDGPSGASRQALPFLRGLELVERWDLACGAGDAEFSYCDLDVGPRPAGAYLVEAIAGREVAHAVALFSKLALVARRTEGSLAVLAVDSRTGAPVANARIAVLPRGHAPATGTTSRAGLFVAKVAQLPVRVVGRSGADAAVLELPAVDAVEEARSALLLTDRGEYRPGERLVFHGFARTAEERLAPPRASHVEVAAYDARGSLFESAAYPLSPQGGFGGELTLPDGLPEGLYRIVATVDEHAAGAEFAVRDAPSPAFEVEARLATAQAGLPARAAVRVHAGKRPLPEAQLTWRAVRTSLGDGPVTTEEVDRGEATADAEGRAELRFDTLTGADARYEVRVVARDGAGRIATASAAATVLRSPYRVTLSTERRMVSPREPVVVGVLARTDSDRPLQTDLKVRIQAARAGTGGEASKERVLAQDLKTDVDGRGTIRFTPALTGYYEVEVTRAGARLAETFFYVTVDGGDIPFSPDALALVPDKPAYAVGDTARVLVLAPFDAATALLTVEGGDLVRHDAVAIRGASAVYQIKVTPALAPDFAVTAQAVCLEKAWRSERLLKVVPRGEALTVRGTLSAGTPPGEAALEVEVVDRAGKPVPGAELFAVVRDGRSVEAPAPPILSFFHPPRLSDGVTSSSTTYRSSSAGQPFAREALEPTEEGYLPFKGLSQGRPRPLDAGTLLATSATTDARGRAVLAFPAPPTVAELAAEVRAAAGPAMGEWSASFPRALPGLEWVSPRFLRPGDEARASLRLAPGNARPVPVELGMDEASAAGTDRAELALAGAARERRLVARLEGLGQVWRTVLPAPGPGRALRGTSGLAAPGRTAIPGAEEGDALYLAATPADAAAVARRAMGSGPEPMTGRAIARVLARVAQWRAGRGAGPELRSAALADLAALAGLAHPEGSFGAYDGAPWDAELTALAPVALALAREEGLEVEEGLLSRAAARLLALPSRQPSADLALALLGEAPDGALAARIAMDLRGELTAEQRAMLVWALVAADERGPAKEVALRLERSVRTSGALACWAESCPADEVPRSALRATAVAVLALQQALPRSPVLAGAVRFLLAHRGTGDFGGDPAGGLATLAVVAAAEPAGARAGSVSVESGGKVATALGRLPPEEEVRVELAGPTALAVGGAAPLLWRLEKAVAPVSSEALGVKRTWAGPSDAEAVVRAGDTVEVTLTLHAETRTGPVRVDDPYPAGLAPIEQEGEHEPFRALDERARRLFLPDRVVFLLPSLKPGDTTLRWQAVARVPGKFIAPAPTLATDLGRATGDPGDLSIEEAAP